MTGSCVSCKRYAPRCLGRCICPVCPAAQICRERTWHRGSIKLCSWSGGLFLKFQIWPLGWGVESHEVGQRCICNCIFWLENWAFLQSNAMHVNLEVNPNNGIFSNTRRHHGVLSARIHTSKSHFYKKHNSNTMCYNTTFTTVTGVTGSLPKSCLEWCGPVWR